jgi:FRG domain
VDVAGIEVCDSLEVSTGRYHWLTDSAVEHLRAAGRLVSTSRDHHIPQHVVQTPSELEAILAEYESFAGFLECTSLLRGQNRDYLDDEGFLSVLPSSYRTQELRNEFSWIGDPSSQLTNMLVAWEKVLISVDVDCSGTDRREGVLDGGTQIILSDRRATTRIASNPQFGAILQHYGFPTPHLDVTSSAAVALYFAHHRTRMTPNGLLFEPVEDTPLASQHEPIPTLHIYFANSDLDSGALTIDLKSLPDLVRVARRPVAQLAHSFTFVVHATSINDLGDGDYTVRYMERFYPRFPVAVVKLSFPYSVAEGRFQKLTQQELFPTDEPLYTALLSANAPYLARYA